MNTRQALERLYVLQDRVLEAIADSTGIVRREGAQAQQTLAARRWQLMRLLREYQIFKHTELFDPAIAAGRPHQVAVARDLKERCTAMGEAFQAYVQRWNGETIAARWSAYETAMHAMTTALERHVADERRRIERLFDGVPNTRHPAAAPTAVRPSAPAEH